MEEVVVISTCGRLGVAGSRPAPRTRARLGLRGSIPPLTFSLICSVIFPPSWALGVGPPMRRSCGWGQGFPCCRLNSATQSYPPDLARPSSASDDRKAPAIGTKIEVKSGLGLGSPQRLGIADLRPPPPLSADEAGVWIGPTEGVFIYVMTGTTAGRGILAKVAMCVLDLLRADVLVSLQPNKGVKLDEGGRITSEVEKLEELRKRIEGGSVLKKTENLTPVAKMTSDYFTTDEMTHLHHLWRNVGATSMAENGCTWAVDWSLLLLPVKM